MSSIADSSSEGRGVTGLTDDVDPDIRKFLKLTFSDSQRFGSAPGLTPSMRRAVAEKVRERWTAGGPVMHSTSELRVGALDTRIRIHYPVADAAPLPTLVYLHGGGWTIFSLDTHDRLMREYAARARCGVVGIDYSLSPEAKFPRALDEIVEVIDWLRAEGAKHGIDPQRIAIGGTPPAPIWRLQPISLCVSAANRPLRQCCSTMALTTWPSARRTRVMTAMTTC